MGLIGLLGIFVYISQWDKSQTDLGPLGKYNQFSLAIGIAGLGIYLYLRGLGYSFNNSSKGFSIESITSFFSELFKEEPKTNYSQSISTFNHSNQHVNRHYAIHDFKELASHQNRSAASSSSQSFIKKRTAEYATSVGIIVVEQKDYDKLSVGDFVTRNGNSLNDGWIVISKQNIAIEVHHGYIVQIVKSVAR